MCQAARSAEASRLPEVFLTIMNRPGSSFPETLAFFGGCQIVQGRGIICRRVTLGNGGTANLGVRKTWEVCLGISVPPEGFEPAAF